ncbi:hypothetical protein QYF61_020957 [Mycteria americana]|uniref:Uncharacterized protein n=1 Tax=Mycteria americana TaxID=33587 RepID=A0AAN7PJX9_MYCAM|nr:hypothetical protein QYF61_020957 [Mycteria americana]
MLTGPDHLVVLYVLCDGTQDDLLHNLPQYRGPGPQSFTSEYVHPLACSPLELTDCFLLGRSQGTVLEAAACDQHGRSCPTILPSQSSKTEPAHHNTTQIPTPPSMQHSPTVQCHSNATQKGCYMASVYYKHFELNKHEEQLLQFKEPPYGATQETGKLSVVWMPPIEETRLKRCDCKLLCSSHPGNPRLNNPSSLSRSSEDFCSRPFTSFVALLCTRSSTSMSLL